MLLGTWGCLARRNVSPNICHDALAWITQGGLVFNSDPTLSKPNGTGPVAVAVLLVSSAHVDVAEVCPSSLPTFGHSSVTTL